MNEQSQEFLANAGAVRRAYRAPELVRYGRVRDIAQSGGSTANEGHGTNNGCIPESKRPCNPNSDPAMKQNAVRVGTHVLGIGLYVYEFKQEYRGRCGHGRQFGVMADEVESVMPQAVGRDEFGFRTVDYSMLGIDRVHCRVH